MQGLADLLTNSTAGLPPTLQTITADMVELAATWAQVGTREVVRNAVRSQDPTTRFPGLDLYPLLRHLGHTPVRRKKALSPGIAVLSAQCSFVKAL
jgi:hypothetical protein